MIKRIKFSNFKSFECSEIDLDQLNVIVGPNSSGKSNFSQLFQFLSDISFHGLPSAISLQGGAKYLTNLNLGFEKELCIEVETMMPLGLKPEKAEVPFSIFSEKQIYSFAIKFDKSKIDNYTITHEKFEFEGLFYKEAKRTKKGFDKKLINKNKVGEALISVFRQSGHFDSDITFLKANKTLREKREDYKKEIFRSLEAMEYWLKQKLWGWDKELLLRRAYFFPPLAMMPFDSIALYDFDPRMAKKAFHVSGKIRLESDGSNIAIILKRILEDETKEMKFKNLVQGILPFMKDMTVKKLEDKYLMVTFKENYPDQTYGDYFPASLLSHGTTTVVACIIACFFEDQDLIIIEEPEKHLHPQILTDLVELFRDAATSEDKQIFITTHSPGIVRAAGVENLLFVTRDERGYSKISRPANSESVNLFLQKKLGIEKLFMQNLLGE